MVARGDLGVEIPAQEVPLIQKQLVLRAKQARIPVIIATQMMETMITSLTPTRAEVNDVANSVMDGADAVMLSGETSVGSYPVQVIQKMSSILQSVEEFSSYLRTAITTTYSYETIHHQIHMLSRCKYCQRNQCSSNFDLDQ